MGPAGIMASIGGQLFETFTRYQDASAQQAMQDAETKRLRQEAAQVERVTAFKQTRAAQEEAQKIGSLETASAASGAISTTGAPLMAIAQQASENELENLLIGYRGQEEATGLRYQADVSKYKSRLLGRQKRYELAGGLLGATGTGMGAFSKYYDNQYKPKTTLTGMKSMASEFLEGKGFKGFGAG